MKQFFKTRMGSIILCALQILVGILLLIDPLGFTGTIIIGAGVVLILAGIFSGVKYFMSRPEVGAAGQLLFRALLLGMAGLLCVTQYQSIQTTFPLLTVIYAGWMLVLAAMKVQKMADMIRLQVGPWYMPGIAAALAAVLAIIILINPFGAANTVWMFVGISLIAESIVDLAGILMK